MKRYKLIFLNLLFFSSTPALAHVLPSDPMNLHHGFMHPLTGVDHLLTLLGVGYLSTLMAPQANFRLSALFLGFMLLGALFGQQSSNHDWAEFFIILTAFIVGLKIIFPASFSRFVVPVLVGFSAFCHGFAHGAEAASAGFAGYLLGMLLASSLLLLAGNLSGKTLHYLRMAKMRVAIGLGIAGFALANMPRLI